MDTKRYLTIYDRDLDGNMEYSIHDALIYACVQDDLSIEWRNDRIARQLYVHIRSDVTLCNIYSGTAKSKVHIFIDPKCTVYKHCKIKNDLEIEQYIRCFPLSSCIESMRIAQTRQSSVKNHVFLGEQTIYRSHSSYILDGDSQVYQERKIVQLSGRSTSQIDHRSIVQDRAMDECKIYVLLKGRPNRSVQTLKSLCTSPESIVIHKPMLLIQDHDIDAYHSSRIDVLSARERFYLHTRGITLTPSFFKSYLL